jgi:hypothetical protein
MTRSIARHPRLAGALALLVVAVAASVLIGQESGATSARLSTFSTAGRRVSLSPREARIARQMGANAVYLLAERGDRAYYRLVGPDGTCLGAGPSEQIGLVTGETCPKDNTFPTRRHPVLDYSIYEAMSHDRSGGLSLYRAEGFAADGVASVAFLRANGEVAVRIPVRGNVFSAPPPRGPVTTLVAYDSAGQEVWRSG